MAAPLDSPFGEEVLEEIPLSRAPLVKVVAQIQYPALSTLVDSQTIQGYAALIRDEYPIKETLNNVVFSIGPEGVQQQAGTGSVSVFQSKDGQWKLALNETSLSIETAAYGSRDDLCARFQRVLEPFIKAVDLPFISRLGVRYINRIVGNEDLAAVPTMFRSPVNSALATPMGIGVEIQQSLAQSVYQVGVRDGLLARWALLPAGALIDPTLDVVPDRSFLFDLDAFRAYPDRSAPAAADIAGETKELAAVAYHYFRWAITDEFIVRFGGTV
jgi:uncharacterized protein (TIGR04255 family)